MKEIPILFNGEMVRAILEGRKTQTRRAVKHGPDESYYRYPVVDKYGDCQWFSDKDDIGYEDELDDEGEYPDVFPSHDEAIRSPFGSIGDRLWVRETFCVGYKDEDGDMSCLVPTGESEQIANRMAKYKASHVMPKHSAFKWTPSIHMPRWASRITLEVTDIYVQRVQEISEEDAIAEGVQSTAKMIYQAGGGLVDYEGQHAHERFAELWQSIYNTWDANPWVWVATFKKVEAAQ